MVDLTPEELARAKKNNLTPERYARLKAESKAPYRGLRKFFYVAFGASGLIGGFVFLAKLGGGGTRFSERSAEFCASGRCSRSNGISISD